MGNVNKVFYMCPKINDYDCSYRSGIFKGPFSMLTFADRDQTDSTFPFATVRYYCVSPPC